MNHYFTGVAGAINSRTKKFEIKRGLEKGSRGRVTFIELRDLFIAEEGRCVYCREPVAIMQRSYGKTVKRLTFDHVKSLHNGGTSTIDNLAVCCQFCNQEKSHHGE